MQRIIGYKGFDKNLQCRGFQYEIGKEYAHKGEVEACEVGFHWCKHPLDTFKYYPPIDGNRYCIVEGWGDISEGDDSKVASSNICISREVTLAELIKAAPSATSGDCSPFATSEKCSPSATSGDYSLSTTSGGYSPSATSGRNSPSATSEKCSPSATSGKYSRSATNGRNSPSATSGDDSPSATSGDYSPSATSGDRSRSATSGDDSPSATSGDFSTSVTNGGHSPAAAGGRNSIAAALGTNSKAKAGVGGAIVLTCICPTTHEILSVRASKVGENGILPGVWYSLDKDGNFVACVAADNQGAL